MSWGACPFGRVQGVGGKGFALFYTDLGGLACCWVVLLSESGFAGLKRIFGMVGDGWAGCGREDRLGVGQSEGGMRGHPQGVGVEARGRDASLAACSGGHPQGVSLQKEEEAFGFALV